MRADARRNRARVLDVAAEAFATEGLSVSVHEIARRAGVGTGTVSRHFPTKEALFQAVLLDRVEQVVRRADALATGEDPGEAFFAFFSLMVDEGAANRGVVDALAGAGYDFEADAAESRYDVMGAWGRLLQRAQQAGALRADVDISDVKALLAGCLDRERHGADPAARDRMLAVVRAGLSA
ncbi:TetR family transcriptional regulator [Streptomyces sp. TS71-3]|nr:TetR family transcriptional regulator [Streptomyces sp. TS71-3]